MDQTPFHRGSAAICHCLAAIAAQGDGQKAGNLGAPNGIDEELFVFLVGEKSEFQKDRRHIRRLQNAEPGIAVGIVDQVDLPLEGRHDGAGQIDGKRLRFAARQIDQDIGDLGRFALEGDAGDLVREVFAGGKVGC